AAGEVFRLRQLPGARGRALLVLLLVLDLVGLPAAAEHQLDRLGLRGERRQRTVEVRQRPFEGAREERFRHREARLFVANLAADVHVAPLLLAEHQPHRRLVALELRLGVLLLLRLLLRRLLVFLLWWLGFLLVVRFLLLGLLVFRLLLFL